MTLSTFVYPLLCGLSVAALPFQPDEAPPTWAGDLQAPLATARWAEPPPERLGRIELRPACPLPA